MKRFLYYFGCTVIMGFVFYLGVKYQIWLEEEGNITFDLMPVLLFSSVFPIFIGMCLRLPKLIVEIKETKQWKFDWIKIVAVGVPSLYITILPILSYYSEVNLLFSRELVMLGNTTLTTTAGIVFGFVLLDSLSK
ncbi:hypothetical protein SAMN05421676_1132 [Salinibacillus kushneri]|uniref:Uncharacterized protein n=1 Tax=Salinibacillus kushneri TaxID=237682 RepID=A0A1I0ILI5_9BACI|nr:hypothetical protein [Salinibacillus kushneri]SET97829.1 hypothetical protein SAMN05421676_1132 [Salinibacillus kushneri]